MEWKWWTFAGGRRLGCLAGKKPLEIIKIPGTAALKGARTTSFVFGVSLPIIIYTFTSVWACGTQPTCQHQWVFCSKGSSSKLGLGLLFSVFSNNLLDMAIKVISSCTGRPAILMRWNTDGAYIAVKCEHWQGNLDRIPRSNKSAFSFRMSDGALSELQPFVYIL